MKRIVIVLVLIVLFRGAYWWFSHLPPPAQPAATPPPSTAPAVTEDPKRAEREALYGAEALAADVQWRENGLGYRTATEGKSPRPGIGATVRLKYVGRLKDGTVFDRSDEKPSEFVIGTTIAGLSVGLQMLGTGGKAVFFIPPSLGYGRRRVAGIPPGSGLIFDVEIVAVNP